MKKGTKTSSPRKDCIRRERCRNLVIVKQASSESVTNYWNVFSSYTYNDEEGVFAESQFVFDLELPLDFKPRVGDREVQDFYLLPVDKVSVLNSMPVK